MFNILGQTSTNSGSSVGMVVYTIFMFALLAAFIIGMWKMFEKAGQPGWAAIIPIYNAYILLKVAGRPGWWLLLFLVPFVNFVVYIIVALDIAKRFGQSEMFGIFMLWLFSGIGYMILGFGDAKYTAAPSTE